MIVISIECSQYGHDLVQLNVFEELWLKDWLEFNSVLTMRIAVVHTGWGYVL